MESVKSNGTEQVVKSSLSSSLSPPWQSNLQQAAMEELNKGQKQAERLLLLLKGVLSSPESRPAAELLVDVGAAFTKALFFLELKKEESESDKPPIHSEGMSSSHEQIKRKFQTSRRSSCRRRAHPYSCTTIFSPKIEDGYGWRKYGQKGIYRSKHPRSYYRCIYKHDRGCPVTRQVQRTEEDDSIFAITYVGLHTCIQDDHTAATKHSLALESNMNNNDNASDDDRKELAAPPSAPTKRDCEEEVIRNESTAGSCSSSEINSVFSGLAPLIAEDWQLY
ncbi:putative WRKY transcription factor 67 [Curcuma longa]|uniref:putative WRKY transcription factor 67 n=1 Tax=Curcuma longa TaxID=136217 RepID=UPI003D9E1DF0